MRNLLTKTAVAVNLFSSLSRAQDEQCRSHTAPRWIFDASCCSGGSNGTVTESEAAACLVDEGPCVVDEHCEGALQCGEPGRCPTGVGFTVDARCCFDPAVGEKNPDTSGLSPVTSAEGTVLLPLPHGNGAKLLELNDLFKNRHIDLEQSGLNIVVDAGPEGTDYAVEVSGNILATITDEERDTWGIGTTFHLKEAIEAFFGKQPSDAWVRAPAGENELYDIYGWQEVQTHLMATSAEIIEITSQPRVVAEKFFENTSQNLTATFNAGISEEVRNIVINEWSSETAIGFKQTIGYEIGFLVAGVSGASEFSFESKVGESYTEAVWHTVGSATGSSMELAPGQGARIELSSSLGTMKVQVNFLASLHGCIATDYSGGYQGHNFWCLDAAQVVAAVGKPAQIELSQIVDIGYFHSSLVKVFDHDTGVTMASFPQDDPPLTLVEETSGTSGATTTSPATTTTEAATTTTTAAATTTTQPTSTSDTCNVRSGTDLAAGTATNIDALPQGIAAYSAGECCEICSSYDQCIAGVFKLDSGDWCWPVKSFNGFETHGGRTVVERQAPVSNACNGARADAACCTTSSPCGLHEGDCDSSSECEGDLVCGIDNCNSIGLSFPDSTWDCCVPPASSCAAHSTTDLTPGTATNTDLLPNGVYVATAWDCCDVCAADPQCVAGVFNTDPNNPWCWTVKSYSGMQYHGERMVLEKQ